jgi:multidrug resistance protein, MATE family
MDRRTYAREARATLVLALPIIVSQLAQVSLGFIDTVMVGRIGPEAIAGVALGSGVFFAFALVFLGVTLAVEPLVSQAFGAGNEAGVQRSVHQGLWAAVVMSPVAVAVLWGAGEALRWPVLGQDPATAALARDWLQAIALGLPAFLAFGALRAFCEGVSRPVAVTVIALGSVGVHVFLNDALIYGRYGLPAYGAVGTGYASAATSWLMLAALGVFVSLHPVLRRYRPLRLGRPVRAALGEVFRVGLPVGGAFFIEAGLFSATALLMGRLGATELAAHQIAIQCASVTFMTALGTGLAWAVRTVQAVGRGDPDGVRRAGLVSISLAVGFMALAAVTFLLVPERIIALYLDPDQARNAAVVQLAVVLLGIAGAFQVFDGLQVAAAGALRGLKDTRAAMLIGLFTYWGVGLTSGAVMAFGLGMGAPGLWWGLVVGLAAAGTGLLTRFLRQARRVANALPVRVVVS